MFRANKVFGDARSPKPNKSAKAGLFIHHRISGGTEQKEIMP